MPIRKKIGGNRRQGIRRAKAVGLTKKAKASPRAKAAVQTARKRGVRRLSTIPRKRFPI